MNIFSPSISTYQKAKELLTGGELVAFPTETVYGLGANALDEQAVKNIFLTKGRPQKNPIIVHVGTKEQITEYATISSPIEQAIIDQLMPGPITILLKKKENIPAIVTAGSEYIGIRIPSNQVALDFLQTVNLPIAAPSANISTKPSPTSAQMVRDNFHENIAMIIDGGDCEGGIESSVVKVEGNRVIITRPGLITKEDLESALPKDVTIEYAQTVSEITPGNMYKHYAPHAKVQIIQNIDAKFFTNILGEKIALILTQETIEKNKAMLQMFPKNIQVINRGTEKNLATCAQRLFAIYHECDTQKMQVIYIQQLKEEGIGYAIMNRVKKSAEAI